MALRGTLRYLEFSKIISDNKKTIEFLREKRLLHRNFYCCQEECSLVSDTYGSSDQQVFQCNICLKRHSIRCNSFFFKSRLTLQVLLSILYYFCAGSTITEVSKILVGEVSKKSILQWYNYYRDVMTTYLVQNPVEFSRHCTIHVDETAIGGKRKYQRGRIPSVQTRWLFGMVCSVHHKFYGEFIEDKSHQSIIPLISRHIQRGAVIHSDGANVYKCLSQMFYTHRYVIHDKYYVDPYTGVHSNCIENVWGNLKMYLKKIRGSQSQMLDGHLDEWIYRYNRKQEGPIFDLLINDIATYYPV